MSPASVLCQAHRAVARVVCVVGCLFAICHPSGYAFGATGTLPAGFLIDAIPGANRLHQMSDEAFAALNRPGEGSMHVDLYLNERYVGNERVEFRARTEPDAEVAACLPADLLVRAGLDRQTLDRTLRTRARKDPHSDEPHSGNPPIHDCVTVSELSRDARAVLTLAELRLDLSIPQIMLARTGTDGSDQSQWDAGITAAFINYSIELTRASSGTQSGASGSDAGTVSGSASCTAGLNMGLWRLRQISRTNVSAHGSARYDRLRSFVDHPLPARHAVVRLGEISTSALASSPISMTGLAVFDDERMLTDSERGYAPEINGLASSRSTVEVRQQGALLRTLTVPAGPFRIDDLRATARRGDLEISVTDESGNKHREWIPSASTPRMIRHHAMRFSVAAGIPSGARTHVPAFDVSVRYGAHNMATAQAAVQWNKPFVSSSIGISANTHIGAWFIDVTHGTSAARHRAVAQTASTRMQLAYASVLTCRHLSFNASFALRTGGGALDLREWLARGAAATDLRDASIRASVSHAGRRRISWHASASQHVRCTGSDVRSCRRSFGIEIGAAMTIGSTSMTLGLAHSRTSVSSLPGASAATTRVSIDVSSRIGTANHAPIVSSRTDLRETRSISQSWSLSGRVSDDLPLSYALSIACRDAAVADGAPFLVGRRFDACVRRPAFEVAYDDAWGTSRLSVSCKGVATATRHASVVLHRGGVTFGPSLSDTFGLLDTHAGSGLHLLGTRSVRTDRHGFAVIPYLTPYRPNTIEFDASRAPRDVTVLGPARDVIPIAGAVSRVQLDAMRRRTRHFRVVIVDGAAPPFASTVRSASGTTLGRTGQAGRLRLDARVHGSLDLYDRSAYLCRIVIAASTVTGDPDAGPETPEPLVCR